MVEIAQTHTDNARIKYGAPQLDSLMKLEKQTSIDQKTTKEVGESGTFDTLRAALFVYSSTTLAPPQQGQQELNETEEKGSPIRAHDVSAQIRKLPRTHIATTFEPHFRQSTVKRLLELVGHFRLSIGRPESAASVATLRAFLTDAYSKSIQAQETRNLATAISLLQDFLRPHWSKISTQKLQAVSEKLEWLGSQDEISPHILAKFYDELVTAVGSRISLDIADEEEIEAFDEYE